MGKDTNIRVAETIAYIGSQVGAAVRPAVTKYLTDEMQRIAAMPGALDVFSDEMHIGTKGSKDDRAARRAIIMLEQLRGAPYVPATTAAQIKQLGAAQLAPRLAPLLESITIVACQRVGGVMNPLSQIFLNRFRANPIAFLQSKRLFIRGSDQATGGNLRNVADFWFLYDFKAVPVFKILTARPATDSGGHSFSAVSIPAVDWFNVPGRGATPTAGSFAQLPGTELTGADVVLTTQFSGCAFCFKVVNSRIFATHIVPDDSVNHNKPLAAAGGGAELARQLAGQVNNVAGGDFAAPVPAGGQFYVFGCGYSNIPNLPGGYPSQTVPDEYMSVIGFFRNGAWEIYSQHVMNATYTAARLL